MAGPPLLTRTLLGLVLVLAAVPSSVTAVYFGFYQDSTIASNAAGANLYVANTMADAVTARGRGMTSLLLVTGVFLQGPPFQLTPAWQANWNATVPIASQLIANGTLLGFFLGDELVSKCCSLDTIDLMARTIKASFPTAIIWYNEGCEPLQKGKTQCGSIKKYKLSASVDWFSIDLYHMDGVQKGWVADNVQPFYHQYIHPLLQSHQHAALVPGSFSSSLNKKCDTNCYQAMINHDAHDFFAWASQDSRIAAIIPWHWDGCESAPDCQSHLDEIGTAELPSVIANWKSLMVKYFSFSQQDMRPQTPKR